MLKSLSVLLISMLVFSCAHSLTLLVPKLENRELRINNSGTGFYYDYCVNWTWFKKDCKEWKTDHYLFTDKTTMLHLKAKGFRLLVPANN